MADISHNLGAIACPATTTIPCPTLTVVTTTTHKLLRSHPGGGIILCQDDLAPKIDKAVFLGLQSGPHHHVTTAIAVAMGEAGPALLRRVLPSGG